MMIISLMSFTYSKKSSANATAEIKATNKQKLHTYLFFFGNKTLLNLCFTIKNCKRSSNKNENRKKNSDSSSQFCVFIFHYFLLAILYFFMFYYHTVFLMCCCLLYVLFLFGLNS